MENKFYSSDRVWTTIVISIVVFMLGFAAVTDGFDDSLERKHFIYAILTAFLIHVILIPKILWNFILNRVRELGKAIRNEE